MSDLLEQARRHFEAGRLSDVEAACRELISRNHQDGEAWHLLGLVAYRVGKLDTALQFIERAMAFGPLVHYFWNSRGSVHYAFKQLDLAEIDFRKAAALRPGYAVAMSNLGNVLRDFGRYEEAIEAFRTAIEWDPQYVAAHNNLGGVFLNVGNVPAALSEYEQAVAKSPGYAEAHYNLANALMRAGDSQRGIRHFREAVTLRPAFVDAHLNLGSALNARGNLAEAEAEFRETLRLRPDYAEAHYNLANTLCARGDMDGAIAEYRAAVSLRPAFETALNNLGTVLASRGDFHEAELTYRQALHVRPDYPEAYYNLANVLAEGSDPDAAIAAYRECLRLRPDYPDAWNNLGTALLRMGAIEDALAAYKRATEMQPDQSTGFNNVANLLKDMGRHVEAEAVYRRAIVLNPADALVHSNLVYLRQFIPGTTAAQLRSSEQEWNEAHGVTHRAERIPLANLPDPDRRLRIGFVSPDFYGHAVCFFLLPLFRELDRAQVEVWCYSSVIRPDALTVQFQSVADRWCEARFLSDEALTRRIREDDIDILIDLSMHSANNRLTVFARRAAPVQMTWLAYPGSTGLETMDYRITDRYMEAPANAPAREFERPLFMPHSWCCYEPVTPFLETAPDPRPADHPITFGALNNFCKVNEVCLRMWAAVLRSVPCSRLMLFCPDADSRGRVAAAMAGHGIEAARLEFCGRVAWHEYLAQFGGMDIFLDTYPVNGMTTTCHALWMGVPVVTRRGDLPVSRASYGLLTTIGLADLAAESEAEFVAIAAALAQDRGRIDLLRATMRERMKSSPLMDAPAFARAMEGALRSGWREWCRKRI